MADEPRRIDLNAAREARGATTKEPVQLAIGDEVFEFPPELPAAFLELILDDRLTEALTATIGADPTRRLLEVLTIDDLKAFAEELSNAYGITGGLGNLSASGDSS